MQKSALALSALALLAPAAHAVDTTAASTLVAVENPVTNSVTLTFSGLSFTGFFFSQVTGLPTGQLTSVSVNATLDASVNYTYADDLTVYVTPTQTLASGGLLQIGGFNTIAGVTQRFFWANGSSSAPGTTVIDTVALTTPITFSGAANGPAIWIGNGYADATAEGTWSGTITLNFQVAAVPEPASWAMGLAGGAALLGMAARRRRRVTESA